ncbi:AAA family ATPase [Pseudoflavonifractor phocaeensis]|uniref:AAA family ATPase n=1 Tax=Pseudoflavonifractor phocaeensis TaxID=1870988 RepID=UPI001FAE7C81|nr:AAA family ATPase [Pseudoflavonifractor phocaeensis]
MTEYKKTAALNPSAATDGGQPLVKNAIIIAENPAEGNPYTENPTEDIEKRLREWEQMQSPDYLHMIGMEELMDQTFPVKEPVIDSLLYKGAYLFAGAPKIGKSFLVLQMAYAVSTGQAIWDYQVHRGAVLYLALEDQYRRLQERMARMFGVDGNGDLMLAVAAKQLGQGLEKQMEYFLRRFPQAQMIVIDTLQKIREAAGDRYSYASDYEIIGQLKTFADHHNICILIVHHTRKQPSEDSFEMISGTTGLLGCADGAFLLHKEKRTDHRAVLDIVGRDQPDQRLRLLRNEETLTWTLEGADCELWKEPPNPLLEQVARLVIPEQPVWQGSGAELLERLGLNTTASSLTRRLNVRAGQLYATYGISYKNIRDRAGSHITLTLETEPV